MNGPNPDRHPAVPHERAMLEDLLHLLRHPHAFAGLLAGGPSRSPSLDALAKLESRFAGAAGEPAGPESDDPDDDAFDDLDGHGVFDDYEEDEDADAGFWGALLDARGAP